MEDFTKYLDESLSKIIGDEKIILLGYSMRGMIAQIYATIPNFAKRLKGLVIKTI